MRLVQNGVTCIDFDRVPRITWTMTDGPDYWSVFEVAEKLDIGHDKFKTIYDSGYYLTDNMDATMDVSCSYDRFRIQLSMSMDLEDFEDKGDWVRCGMEWYDTWVTQL